MSVLNADTEKYNSLNDSREGYLIEMKDISKYFPGVKALQNVDFKLKQGEVHCLLGENGAGKSTLIKILSGDYTMDKGEILMEGKPVSIKNSHDAIALGIRTVYQELNLVPGLTVAENMFLGAEIGTGLCEIFVNRREMERKASEVLKKIGVGINPGTLVKDLTTAQQQMVEIARSLTREGRCAIIMDEPTASISEKDTGDLFRIIRELKTQGISIVYISHRMHELYQIADRVTVLRDGQYIGTYGIKNTPMDEIVTAMVGREIEKDMRVPHGRTNILAFEAKNINLAPLVKNASFKVCKGEILGFSGLVGSGRTELMRAIFGAEHMDSGEVFINGKKTSIKSPKEAVRAGLCYLSEDRKNQGLVLNMEIYKNITLTNMAAVTNGVFLAKQSELSAALEKANTLSLKYSNVDNRLDPGEQAVQGISVPYVGASNDDGGYIAGKFLAEQLGGKGKVAIIEGIQGVDNAEGRKNGANRAFAEFPDIEVVASQSANWETEQALNIMTNILQANPDLNGVFCANDMMAYGAVNAIEAAGLSEQVLVQGYDALAQAKAYILVGKMVGTIDQMPNDQGYYAVQYAVDTINGIDVPDEKLVDLVNITAENAG